MEIHFAENLKKLRKQYRVTQTYLGDCVGVSQRAISHYEDKNAEPSVETLAKIADFFGITIDELVK